VVTTDWAKYTEAVRSSTSCIIFMPAPDRTGRRKHNVLNLSIRSSIGLFVGLLPTCDHDILKMNELILMQIGTSDPWGEGMKCSTLGSVGQRSRSREAKDRFGGPMKASFSTQARPSWVE